MSLDKNLQHLNPAQRQAVLVESGPLLVLAGAGTGKTRVVTFRMARLISRGIRPERILAVTFTNKAANEMRERVKELLGKRLKEKPEISTFHSLCVRILRRHITQLGYPERFSIYDRSDQESIASQVLREINVPTATLRPGDLLAIIGQWKTRGIRPPQALGVASTDKEHLGAIAYRRYQKALRAAGAVDFDDLLLCTEELLESHPDVRKQEAARFDHIMIDEYQDTNTSQYRIIRHLARSHRNLCVVGDDDQSIYAWRGAEVRHILNFNKDWPDATVVRLEENYRCTEQILQLANRLIRYNSERHDKTLRAARPGGDKPKILQLPDETTEAEQVVADIARQLTKPELEPGDFAILFRTNEQPRLFEAELRKAKLPYTLIGGMSFYDRAEVRDLIAYLRVIAQPRDETALLRVINTPARGISRKAVTALVDHAVAAGQPVWNVLPEVAQLPDFSRPAIEGVQQFQALINHFAKEVGQNNLTDTIKDLVARLDYRREIERRFKDDPDAQASRWGSVEEVINSLAQYTDRAKEPTLVGFLDEIALTGREQDKDKERQLARNAITLMTLHSAKGLEFPHVYMVGLEEGILPHRRTVDADGAEVDEERRLCYVGITRAQERLTLSFALTRRKWGKPRPTHPSRFLFEITGQADNPHHAASRPTAPRSAPAPHSTTRPKPARTPTSAAKRRPTSPPAKGRNQGEQTND